MKKIKLFPAPHVEIRIHVSEEMERDYAECQKMMKRGEDYDCDRCSWANVSIYGTGACELKGLKEHLGEEYAVRLTDKTDSGNWCLRDVPWDQLKPGVVITKKIWEKLYGALWKLKDYEDTGLSPEEVESVNDFEKSQTYRAIAELQEEREKHRWIPVTEKLPELETYILVSFDNFTLPDVATYRVDDDGSGAFYPGDEDYTYLSVGFYVNAWMPLPKPYRAEMEEN